MADFLRIGNVEIELKTEGDAFLGLGRITIDGRVVRAGVLPLRPYTATHDGIEYDRFVIDQIEQTSKRIVIHTRALGVASPVAAVLDHSLDPVWNTRAWDGRPLLEDRLDWIIEPGAKRIGGVEFAGFSYSFRFRSKKNEIYYLLDRATWELDGDASGVTLLRQQMGTDPKVTLRARTDYNTSAIIGFPLHPIMTHDIPRWASEQGFDYQYKGKAALIGLFEHCGLIRTIVTRNAGDAEIRHFDKHIFDQTNDARTVKKFIGVGTVGDETDQLNAWTRVFDVDQDNVLGEFGMHRTYPRTTLSHNFWLNFDVNSYREDLLPAAAALGFQQLFIDPFWENDMTKSREGKLPPYLGGNMCCPHEYEVAQVLGGIEGYKKLADDARALGIEVISWIASHQSAASQYMQKHATQVIKLADGRHWYGSGYNWLLGMDVSSDFGAYFRDSAINATQATGVAGFLYDSFYNFGFMPVNFHTPDPAEPENAHKGKLKAHTQWRQVCEVMAAWQKAGMHMLIESLGPWGQPQHGVHGAYNAPGSEPLAYQCAVSIGYSIIPTPGTATAKTGDGPEVYYRLLANKAPITQNLWTGSEGNRVRLDRVASPLVRQANLDYRAVLPLMHTRTLLPGNAGVLWQPAQGKQQVLFSYLAQSVPTRPGVPYLDQTTGECGVTDKNGLPAQALHTYVIG